MTNLATVSDQSTKGRSAFARVRTAVGRALFSGTAEPPRPGRTLFGIALSQLVDCLLAFFLLLIAVNNTTDPVAEPHPMSTTVVLLCLVATGSLALRRHWPLIAWRVALSGWLLLVIMEPDHRPEAAWAPGLAMLLILYMVAARCEPETALGVWIVSVLATLVL